MCCSHQIQNEPAIYPEIVEGFTFNIQRVFYVSVGTKYWFMEFANRCILFLFTFTVSQLFLGFGVVNAHSVFFLSW